MIRINLSWNKNYKNKKYINYNFMKLFLNFLQNFTLIYRIKILKEPNLLKIKTQNYNLENN